MVVFTMLIVLFSRQNTSLEQGSLVYSKTKDATVSITCTYPNTSKSSGSGFIIDIQPDQKLVIVTCAHLLLQADGTSYPLVKSQDIQTVITAANNNQFSNVQVRCEILGIDASADIAVIRTLNVEEDKKTGFDFNPSQNSLSWGNSTEILPGMTCYIIGNPLGVDFTSISGGLVRDNKYIGTFHGGAVESISSSASILPGNSGSPILDILGNVIGISTWVASSSATAQETFVGGPNQFMAEKIVHQLRTNINRGYIGVRQSAVVAGPILDDLRKKHTLFITSQNDQPQGILIQDIDTETIMYTQNSQLRNTNIEIGDILVAITYQQQTTFFGAFHQQFSPTRITWFVKPGETIICHLLKPSTSTHFSTSVIVDRAPPVVDLVSSGSF